jgi:hypothetical protein
MTTETPSIEKNKAILLMMKLGVWPNSSPKKNQTKKGDLNRRPFFLASWYMVHDGCR